MERAVGIVIVEPERYILTVNTVHSYFRQKIRRCKNTFLKFITDQLLADFLAHMEGNQHMRCVGTGNLIIHDHIIVTIRTLCSGGVYRHGNLATTVGTYLCHLFLRSTLGCCHSADRLSGSRCLDRSFRSAVFLTACLDHTVLAFFAVLTLTERTEHLLSLRAVNYITAAVFTSKDHFTPRLLPFTTFFFVEPFYLTIDSIVFPYRKIHIIFSYRSFTMIVSCFHQVCVILRQESVIDHMAPFIPKTITIGISHFLRETDHDIKVLAPHLFHINILTVPQK